MGYILKNGGGGGGDATAANQTIQINSVTQQIQQLQDTTGAPSVFKDSNTDKSVFLDDTLSESVFKDDTNNSNFRTASDGKSVFKDNTTGVFKNDGNISVFKTVTDKSIFELSKISNGSNTFVQSFQNTTPATLATDIQTWLQANAVCIIQIVYADAGGVAPNPHTALIIYNTI